jgi:EmrB/QacA subfamily drug resistance transporter
MVLSIKSIVLFDNFQNATLQYLLLKKDHSTMNIKTDNYKWVALSCTSLGALLSILNGSMLILALPDLMRELHIGIGIVLWIVISYLLAITVLVPAIGRITDMFGRKRLFVAGFIVFTLGSLLAGFAIGGIDLLVYRVVQSIGGSLLIANSTAIVTDAFPRPELGKALGINAMIISIAFVLGPILGGLLIPIGWRSIFLINVPLGIAGTIWAGIQLKEMEGSLTHEHFDWAGMLSFTVGMVLLLLGLTMGSFFGWLNMPVLLMLIGSVLILGIFFIIEVRSSAPMLDLKLMKSRVLLFAFLAVLLNGIARGAVMFLLVFYFQGVKGYDPLKAGILLTPFALAQMVVSPPSGWLSDRYGARHLASLGLLVSAIGLGGFIFISEQSGIFELVVWMVIMGAGSGLFFSPNTSAIMGAVPPLRRGIAAGIRTMMNNAGMVISMALSLAVISSSISPQALEGLFTGMQIGSHGIAVSEFITGLRAAFTVSLIASVIAAVISFLRGKTPVWNGASAAQGGIDPMMEKRNAELVDPPQDRSNREETNAREERADEHP